MNTIDPKDPKTWPIADCEPTDIFLGVTTYDYAPQLTEEQRAWPVAECVPTDICLTPALVLELKLSPNAVPAEVAQDTAELLLELSTREQQLGGSGLLYDKHAHSGRTPSGVVRLVLRPKLLANSKQRLQQLAKLLDNATTPSVPSSLLDSGHSFVACQVVILA